MNIRKAFENCPNQLWGNKKLPPKETFKELFEKTSAKQSCDFYGSGENIENFESKFASLLGKESALFLPSGTMGQQIALRVLSEQKKVNNIYFHPLSHLEIHEQRAIYHLHPNLKVSLIGNKKSLIELRDLEEIKLKYSILLIELPQRELGGLLPTWKDLVELSSWCKNNNVILHLDGARLWESLPYYNKSAKEVCDLFESVYVSFYKGLGAIAGALIAGNKSFIKECKIWQRRYGGNLISLFPYYVSAEQSYNKRIKLMGIFHQKAKDIATFLNKLDGVKTFPIVPQTNMFHIEIHQNYKVIQNAIIKIMNQRNIKVLPIPRSKDLENCKIEFSVGDNTLKYNNSEIEQLFNSLYELIFNK